MMRSMLVPILIILAFASPVHAAEKTKTALLTCGPKITDLSKELDRIKTEAEAWAPKQNKALLSSSDLQNKSEGRRLQLFAAHLLPPEFPFRKIYRDCWSQYYDFAKAVSGQQRINANAALDNWHICLKLIYETPPLEAQELLACWQKLKNKK